MRLFIILAVSTLSLSVQAEVYRCMEDGKKVYTDEPCKLGAKPHELPEISTVPAIEGIDLEKSYEARLKSGLQRREQDDEVWLDSLQSDKARLKRVDAAILARKVIPDMTSDEVRRAIGSPEEVEYNGSAERWIYTDGGKRRVVSLQDGRVSSTGGR